MVYQAFILVNRELKMKKILMFLLIVFSCTLEIDAQSNITIDAGAALTVESGADICANSKTINGTVSGGGTWCSSSPLPVELISFTVISANDQVILNWQTASEVNNYGYNVERKPETGDWTKIGFVKGNGNSNSPKKYSYIDVDALAGKVSYRLKQIDLDGRFEYSNVVAVLVAAPALFSVKQNFPNPFNPTTTINYQIPATAHVSLKVYDMLGREVATLVNEQMSAGNYQATFNGSNLSSGVYLYQLRSGSFVETKKLVLLK
jgi:Secretion system C-terminal sorting domain